MESESLPPFLRRQTLVHWSNLPPELLPLIAAHLTDDLPRFRSVCRSWRHSISPPPLPHNKISPLFPRRVSFCLESQYGCHPNSDKKYLFASAVYLLSPRADTSQSWIASVQEPSPGILFLRHALTHGPFPSSSNTSIDLSEWTLTRIAISYSFRFGRRYDQVAQSDQICSMCDCVVRDAKVAFVSGADDCVRNLDALAVYNLVPGPEMRLCSLSLNGNGVSQYVEDDDEVAAVGRVEDFVEFGGRIYAVDNQARVYVFDSAELWLHRMDCGQFPSLVERESMKRFVVSDGDLYLVSQFCVGLPQVFKFVMDEMDERRCCLERIYSLGHRVFFIVRDSSFSISDRDLPPPLRGNCVVIARGVFPLWNCSDGFTNNREMAIFPLGGELPQFEAYSALFTPPSLWINQLRRGDSEKKKKKKEVAESCSH